VSDERERAERFAAQFRAVYLTFHRRDAPRSRLAGASRALLEHLAMAGPLTIGEAAAHLSRAMTTAPACESCGMPIETGRCSGQPGALIRGWITSASRWRR
jgi:hypothetical protein